ncbi:MAG: EstGX1 [Acidimicrobiales bacterium]|nr:EstGX1 [Acidimicrobiales bacterium]
MTEGDAELVTAVLAASRALVAVAARSLDAAPTETTLSQYRALVVLASRGPLLMSVLARTMALSPSSATRLAERLERKGLVERHRSETSRREIELRLAAEGSGLVDTVMAARRKEIERVIAEIPVLRRTAVLEAFRDFSAAAGEPLELAPSIVPGI